MSEVNENMKLPKGWEWVTISDLIDEEGIFCDGDWIESKDQDANGDVRLIQLADIGDGFFRNKSDRYLTSSKAQELNCTFLTKDDILVARMPEPLGRACIFPLNGDLRYVTAVDVCIIRPNNKIVDIKFLAHIINAPQSRNAINNLETGTTRKRISRKNLATILYPLPPLKEQQQIVSKIEELFSELDKSIEQLKTAQRQLKVYRQSVLKWAFEGKLTNENLMGGVLPDGWKIMSVGKVCKCIVPNRDKPKSFTGNIKWITTPNLNENSIRIKYSDISTGLTDEEVELYNARVIPVGGVIMTCVGAFGLSAIVETPIVINQQLHAFVTNDLIEPKYLAYCIKHNKSYFESKSTSTTIQYLNKENCNSMPLPLCSIEEQRRVVQEIESRLSIADKLEETITNSLQQAEALRQSVLKKAFEGKLLQRLQTKVVSISSDARQNDHARKVLACELVLLFANDKHFGRTKFQKVLYLCEQHAKLDFETSYLQKAAGPLDTQFFYSFLKEMEKENWVIEIYKETPKGLMSQFDLGENASVMLKQFPVLFKHVRKQIRDIYEWTKDKSTNEAELVATIYAVWNNQILQSLRVTDNSIVKGVYEWSAEKGKFSKEEIAGMRKWMMHISLVPSGFGKLVDKKK